MLTMIETYRAPCFDYPVYYGRYRRCWSLLGHVEDHQLAPCGLDLHGLVYHSARDRHHFGVLDGHHNQCSPLGL